MNVSFDCGDECENVFKLPGQKTENRRKLKNRRWKRKKEKGIGKEMRKAPKLN